MTLEHAISIPRTRQRGPRDHDVQPAALCRSIARGEAVPNSATGILIGVEPKAPVAVFECVAITQYRAILFPIRIDGANCAILKSRIRPSVERDAIYAF